MAPSRETQRRLKELAAALKADPGSIPRRLELASALNDAGRPADAIELYRGVAEVYAEEGRLVQAMAVCKGILEIDPEHRDTLEMLATLAQKRAARKSGPQPVAATLRHVDGRWVAEPAGGEEEGPTPPVAYESTPRHFHLAQDEDLPPGAVIDEEVVNGLSALDDEAVPAPVEKTDPSIPIALVSDAAASPDHAASPDDAASPDHAAPPDGAPPALDFPADVKKLARGDRLLELAPDTTEPQPRVDLDDAAPPPASDPTRAATARALESGRQPSPAPTTSMYDDEEEPTDVGAAVHDAISSPFPRPELEKEPPPFPLLSELPRAAFVELLSKLTVLRLDGGIAVLREGEIGEACYLIAEGSVRVTKGGTELAVLGPGSFFGEFAVLADQRRHAAVETVEPVELLEVRRELIDQLVAAHPGVARTLRRFYRERLLQTLMATAPFFDRLSVEERAAISDRFRPRRFGRGARIIEEGTPGGGLFLILVGEVQILRGSTPDDEVELGRLGEGSYFGEMSLLRGGVASATVRATRMTEVVQLPPRDFYEVVSQHPVLWDRLRSEAEKRELANHAILAGEARKSGDGTFYLV